MKLTNTGYRTTKNGAVIHSTEKEAITKDSYVGNLIKEEGIYYYFNRKQGDTYIYLP